MINDKSNKIILMMNTQAQPKFPQSFAPDVLQAYQKLNLNIDSMQDKVDNVIDKHESQFMLAYRSHITKVKRQLAEIKKKSQDQEKMFSSNDRIKFLEKQIAVFREQSLRLYDKLEKTNNQMELYKRKYQQVLKSYKFAQDRVKQMLKQQKTTLALNQSQANKIKQLEQQINLKGGTILSVSKARQNPQSNRKKLNKSVAISKLKSSDQIIDRQLNYSITQSTSRKNNHQSSTIIESTNFRDVFFECVKAVKREIAERKQSERVDIKNIASIQQFRQMDKIKVLQLFISNSKLYGWMCEKLFPNSLLQKIENLKNYNNGMQSSFLVTSPGFGLPKMREHGRYGSVLDRVK